MVNGLYGMWPPERIHVPACLGMRMILLSVARRGMSRESQNPLKAERVDSHWRSMRAKPRLFPLTSGIGKGGRGRLTFLGLPSTWGKAEMVTRYFPSSKLVGSAIARSWCR